MAYARCYSDEDTEELLKDWIISLGISFIITEPAQILFVVALPFIFKNSRIEACMDRLKDAGIDPTLLG